MHVKLMMMVMMMMMMIKNNQKIENLEIFNFITTSFK